MAAPAKQEQSQVSTEEQRPVLRTLVEIATPLVIAWGLRQAGELIGRGVAHKAHDIESSPRFKEFKGEADTFATKFEGVTQTADVASTQSALQSIFEHVAKTILTPSELHHAENYMNGQGLRRGKRGRRKQVIEKLGETAFTTYREIKLRDDDTFENDANGLGDTFASHSEGHAAITNVLSGGFPIPGTSLHAKLPAEHVATAATHTINAMQQAEEDIEIAYVRKQMKISGIDRSHIRDLEQNQLPDLAKELFRRSLFQEATHKEDRTGEQTSGLLYLAMAHHVARTDLNEQQKRDVVATAYVMDHLATRKAQLAQEAQQAQIPAPVAAK